MVLLCTPLLSDHIDICNAWLERLDMTAAQKKAIETTGTIDCPKPAWNWGPQHAVQPLCAAHKM